MRPVRRLDGDGAQSAYAVKLLHLVALLGQIFVRKPAVPRHKPLSVVYLNHVAPERVGIDFGDAPVLYGDNVVALCAAEIDAVVNSPVVRSLVLHHLVRAVILADVRAHRQGIAAGVGRIFAVVLLCRLCRGGGFVVGDVLYGVVRLCRRLRRDEIVYIVLP